MAQLFPKQANGLSQASLAAGAAVGGSVLLALFLLARSGYATGEGTPYDQTVPFSHNHHTTGIGIDCRYCHTTVETSASASIPPTQTCMNCHSQIWTNAALLEPVRESYRTGKSLEWRKVNDLPDFAYFNHSAHVNKGVGCTTCHGQVGEMPLVYQAQSLQMQWCVNCHLNPEQFLRPRSEVMAPVWNPPANQLEVGAKLRAEYHANPRLSCSTCHR
jgi:hypothetical protein